MKVEGIIIHKTPYKERDLICNVLLRSGRKLSVYFYGGMGGGKNQKGSFLEIGAMISVELADRRKKIESELYMAKEFQLIWISNHIRGNYQAFCLACFYMEYINKIAIEEHLEDGFDSDQEGIFNVLSNSLFYMDHAIVSEKFNLKSQLFLFFGKLIINLGVQPNTEACLFCEKELSDKEICLFDSQNGGFSCVECSSQRDVYLSENKLLQEEFVSSLSLKTNFKKTFTTNFKDYDQVINIDQGIIEAIYAYLNYQFGFNKENFKTWKMIC